MLVLVLLEQQEVLLEEVICADVRCRASRAGQNGGKKKRAAGGVSGGVGKQAENAFDAVNGSQTWDGNAQQTLILTDHSGDTTR